MIRKLQDSLQRKCSKAIDLTAIYQNLLKYLRTLAKKLKESLIKIQKKDLLVESMVGMIFLLYFKKKYQNDLTLFHLMII